MVKSYRNHSKVAGNPKNPYEKERLAAEAALVGEYGLKNKREVWRLQYTLSKIRSAARQLMTLEEHDPIRIFQGKALLRRMERLGLLKQDQLKLDYILGLTVAKLMERRLQTLVYKTGLARSVHHSRVLVRQGHIRVGKQVVNVPSFLVRVESERHIQFALNSPFGGGRPGRLARRKQGNNADDE